MNSNSMLTLVIVKAELKHDTEMFGKMDPFVKLTSEHLKLQTKVHENGGKKPVWDQPFNIDPDYLGDEVKFWVLDQDLASQDIIGHCTIKKEELILEEDTTKELDLVYGAKNKNGGKLYIRFQCKKKVVADKIAAGMNKKFGLLNLGNQVKE